MKCYISSGLTCVPQFLNHTDEFHFYILKQYQHERRFIFKICIIDKVRKISPDRRMYTM